MKNKTLIMLFSLGGVIVLGILLGIFFMNKSENGILIKVNSPKPGETVQSPLQVTGQARGSWYFEASFPVKLLDGNGNLLSIAVAQAQGEWMTTEFVPFKAELFFSSPSTDNGTLILEKDNPSGLPENSASIEIPVKFLKSEGTTKLYGPY